MKYKKACNCAIQHGPMGLVYEGNVTVDGIYIDAKSKVVVCSKCGKPWSIVGESGNIIENRNVEIREIGG